MAIQTMVLDPGAVVYSNDDIITKINAAETQITRAASVAAAARPIGAGEVTNTELAEAAAKANLDAIDQLDRGYIKTAPGVGEFKVVSVQRDVDGKLAAKFSDVPIPP